MVTNFGENRQKLAHPTFIHSFDNGLEYRNADDGHINSSDICTSGRNLSSLGRAWVELGLSLGC